MLRVPHNVGMQSSWKKIRYFLRYIHFHTLHRRNREAIEAWQARRLMRLVAHARRSVPLFRELYADISEITSLMDLACLPVTSKKNYLGKAVEYYTNNSAPLLGRWSHTSGTSGQPFTVLKRIQLAMNLYTDSIHYRTLLWEKPWRLDATWAKIATIKVRAQTRHNRLFVSVAEFLSDEESVVRKIADFEPYVLEGYAAVLLAVAKKAKELNIPICPRYVISGGENMTPAMRSFITDALHTEVVSRYGMEEVGVVGTECSVHDGHHTNCECIIVEIVDEEGNQVPDGEEGRIVVTDLFNYSMPYIRYDTGDHGRLSWQKCACGVRAPRVWLEGRHAAFLDFPKRRIHQLEFDAALDTYMNVIEKYKVVKRSDSDVEVRIVPGSELDDASKSDIVRSIQKLVSPDITVSLLLVDSIPFSERGKSQIIADESGSQREHNNVP
jgi:phenylacetate-CoA ligase